MRRSILLVGVFLAVVAFVVGVSLANRVTPRPSPAPPTVTVVVAARNIALGFEITADDLTTMTVALANKPADAFADPSELVGAIVRRDVQVGQIMTRSMLVRTG